MILTVIADIKNNPIEDEIFDYYLFFLINLLEGGNPKIQKTIFTYFTTIPASEYIFEKFHSVFSEQINELKQSDKSQSQDGENYGYKPKDNLKLQITLSPFKKAILEKVLRVLQLFTEGHNLELQQYIKNQTFSRNSYDMVVQVIELLNVYHKNMTVENYENILRCIETLTEFVQV